ncbi:Aste57867_10669 [Aphanomyces stellatus]|uniref:phosphoethanolamine N-methyltransferase n=1 Tax=Aphanomyces stellatus TaxID=120398 RepID=A0A485KR24_9STRA|nr:hypothetical protein As57867_010629 [Aphanomyces stellatus]VFT87541.1 Aste57867_10669 [Aphanomyces stellatus]
MLLPSSLNLSAIAVPAACFLAGYFAHVFLTQKPSKSRFHLDSTLSCLTKHKSPITQTSTWINLGLWTSEDLTFPAACERLALRLGQAAGLGAHDSVLDVGCGRGDQCVLWTTHFNVPRVVGVDITPEHIESATQLVAERNLGDRIRIVQGSATALAALDVDVVTKIVSCDAAYHFDTRAAFVAQAFALLQSGGVLAVVDIVVSDEVLAWTGMQRVQLRGLCSMAGIPFENLKTVAQYQDEWTTAGFQNVRIEPLESVPMGFATFVGRQRIQLAQMGLLDGFDKFELVAETLAICAHNKYLQFVVATGDKA